MITLPAACRAGPLLAAACCLLGPAAIRARAQEALNTPAATQPGAGRLYLREQFRFTRMGNDPGPEDRRLDEMQFKTTLTVGVTGSTSLSFAMPVVRYDEKAGTGAARASDQGVGIGDLTALFRWRFAQWNLGPIDTIRLMVYTGVEASLGNSRLYADSTDPLAGVVATIIHGRHGINLNASYKFVTDGVEDPHGPGEGRADLLRADAAYLYRLSPEEYTPDTTAAWYAVCELNTTYETNGDVEMLISPGLLYEGTSWAAEIGVQLPIYRDIDHRLETEFVLVAGIRLLF